MNKGVKISLIITGIILVFAIVPALFNWQYHNLYRGPGATARRLMKKLKNEPADDSRIIFTYRYRWALEHVGTFEIEDPDFEITENGKDEWLIGVTGMVKNRAGIRHEEHFTFKMIYNVDDYRIDDSYGFIDFNENQLVFNGESDVQKVYIVLDLPNTISILDIKPEFDDDGGLKGRGRIRNNSPVAVKFVEGKAVYRKEEGGEEVNSDKFYLVNGEALMPGDTRSFEWHTPTCNDCGYTNLSIDFEKMQNAPR